MRLVNIETPYAGKSKNSIVAFFQRWKNRRYARACMRDCLRRGEAPIASHLLYTQRGILCDEVSSERQWGIEAGLAWNKQGEATVVYLDRGLSDGMRLGVLAACEAGRPVEYRYLDANDAVPLLDVATA